ncbi:MAG: hypothetical protein D6728_12460 [Cyanobacteria bacterium J055]|nr:MAG: hypothetical protein D6728_12460 [Cyanobacteria bacterium J055]
MASLEGQQSEVSQRFRKALPATASRVPFAREAGNFDDVFDDGRVPQPAGLAYSPKANKLILLPAQPNRFQSELSSVTLDRDPLPGSDKIAAVIDNPINTVFDPKFNRWIGWNSKNNQLVEVSANADGNLDATKLKLKPKSLGIQDPQGITVNPTNGDLFFLDSQGKKIVRLQPAANGTLDIATASISQIPLPGHIASPRGIAFEAATGNLHLLSPSQKTLYELSQTGQVVNTRDVSRFNLKNPQGLTFAPSGDRTDNPQEQSLYVADSGANSAGIVELSFITTALASANAQLYYVRTIDTSQFDPPSPDPSGIAYLDPANTPSGSHRFLIADGEVNEIPTLFTGDNYFEMSLSGTLSRMGSGIAYTNEPTGVDLNPANGHLFVSDDSADRIFEVIPGGDGLYGSADDTVVGSFSTRSFGSFDPEGVAFGGDNLFVVDGVNSEVYRFTTSGTLVSQFDTESLGIIDPEGVEYAPESGNLYLQGHPNNVVAEVTTSGSLVQIFDTSAANAVKPAGLAIGANSIVPGAKSLYIVDRGVDNNAEPNENDGKVYEFSFALTNQPPVVNAGADLVVLADASLDGTVSDDGLPGPPNNVTISWSKVSGVGTVTFTPANAADTTASFSAPGTYQLRLTADDSELSSIDDVSVVALNPQSTYFLSSNNSGSVGGVLFADEDVLAYDSLTGNWWKYFDGSDVGLTATNLDLDALYINPDGSILLSVDRATTIPTLGAIEDSDIVRFVPTATGETTAGTYEWYFDGSDVGLDTDNEDIDAIGFAPDGRLVVSTRGSFNAGGISGQDEDLFAFDPTTLGASTSGTWSMYFDGSDVDLSTTSSEDVDAVWIDPNGHIHFSTDGAFSVTSLSGDENDIAKFVPSSLGDNTNGTFSLFWDGSANEINSIDGFARV